MQTLFPEHFPITEPVLEDIWANGIVVFDTNTLLRLYRYKKQTSDEIIALWRNLGERLWIPYQVAWEYNNNRAVKIREAVRSYTDIIADLRNAADSVTNKLRDLKDFGVHPQAGLESDLEGLVKTIVEKTDEVGSKYEASPTGEHYSSIHLSIGEIFEGKIGAPPTEEELKDLLQSGQSRFDDSLPPGLRDVVDKRKKNRPEREVFGDYILWREILNHARSLSKGVIFVTEDAKDDWWLKEDGRTIGVLPSLRAEFLRVVGSDVHFYRIGFFLEQAKARMLAEVSKDSVQDVERTKEFEILELEHFEPKINRAAIFSRFIDDWAHKADFEVPQKYLFSDNEKARNASRVIEQYRDKRVIFDAAKSRYRALGKATRSRAARGDVDHDIMRVRIDYLLAKRKYENAKKELEDFLVLPSDDTDDDN